jgi:hypothetical protein
MASGERSPQNFFVPFLGPIPPPTNSNVLTPKIGRSGKNWLDHPTKPIRLPYQLYQQSFYPRWEGPRKPALDKITRPIVRHDNIVRVSIPTTRSDRPAQEVCSIFFEASLQAQYHK